MVLPMESFFIAIDPGLIWAYRLIPEPICGYFLGTFILALGAVLVGEYSVSVAIWLNQKHTQKLNNALVRWNDLSVRAVEAGDSPSYHQFNREANQVFGKIFFTNIAYSAGMLWPAPFVLSWMDLRFGQVDFPLPGEVFGLGDSVGYSFTFILLYILAYILLKPLKSHLPFLKPIQALRHKGSQQYHKMRSLADLLEKRIQQGTRQ